MKKELLTIQHDKFSAKAKKQTKKLIQKIDFSKGEFTLLDFDEIEGTNSLYIETFDGIGYTQFLVIAVKDENCISVWDTNNEEPEQNDFEDMQIDELSTENLCVLHDLISLAFAAREHFVKA